MTRPLPGNDLVNPLPSPGKHHVYSKATLSRAGMLSGHEISHNLLLIVGEYDLYFDGKLFKVGEFYRPRIKAKYESQGKIKLKVEHGLAANRKEAEITVDLDKVTLN